MKKTLALVLAMILLLSTRSACGNNGGSAPAGSSNAVAGNAGGGAAPEVGVVIETGDKINSTYTNNTPDANLSVTAVEDTLTIALASEPASLDIFQLSDSAATLVSKVHCEAC